MTDSPLPVTATEVELLPCPFCGSGPARQMTAGLGGLSGVELMVGGIGAYVWCGTCGGEAGIQKDADAAITAWNTRAPDPSAFSAGERAGIERAIYVAKSECGLGAAGRIVLALEALIPGANNG